MVPDEPDDLTPPPRDALADDPRSELRGKDLVSRSREELAAALDPETLAQLASWFDRPSAALIAEAASEEADAARARSLADRLAVDADPRLLAILERHNQMPDRLAPPWPEIKIHVSERIIPRHVRDALDRLPSAAAPAERRHYDPPPDIAQALERDTAPQALLRDLYRPVQEYDRRLVAMFDPDEVAPVYQVGNAMGDRPPIEWIGRALDALVSARARFTSIVREPWADHLAAVLAQRKADREAAS